MKSSNQLLPLVFKTESGYKVEYFTANTLKKLRIKSKVKISNWKMNLQSFEQTGDCEDAFASRMDCYRNIDTYTQTFNAVDLALKHQYN
jgi:hypothetical protein